MFKALAVAFLAALLAGRLAAHVRVPRVTGYLLVGLLLGPSFAALTGAPTIFSAESLIQLRFVSDIALALIMLNIGAQFQAVSLRRWRSNLVKLSLLETGVTFVLVSVSLFFINLLLVGTVTTSCSQIATSSAFIALFAGIIATATAPAATLLVVREYRSEGPITDLVLALTGMNNLISIIGYDIILLLLTGIRHQAALTIFAPFVIGGAAGFACSYWAQVSTGSGERRLFMLGTLLALVAVSGMLRINLFLAALACGAVLSNASPKVEEMFASLRGLDQPLYVLFFIIAGAGLHLESLPAMGLLGVAYVAARAVGKMTGNRLGARAGQFGEDEQRWLGFALLSQAGVAIGLAGTLTRSMPEIGEILNTVILGAVVFFELVGPISMRHALVHAGEVPVLMLLSKKAPAGTFEGFHHVVEHFGTSLGLPVGGRLDSAADIPIRFVMRKKVETLPETMPFNEILKHIAHSRYDRFPVVDQQRRFVGVIDYRDIRDILFDESLSLIVVARDLSNPEPLTLLEHQTLAEALALFRQHSDITYLPVLHDRDQMRLVGMISQNDVLAAFQKGKGP